MEDKIGGDEQGGGSTFITVALVGAKTNDTIVNTGHYFEYQFRLPDAHRGQTALLFIPIANDLRPLYILTSCVCFLCVRSGSFHLVCLWHAGSSLEVLVLAQAPPRWSAGRREVAQELGLLHLTESAL